jgi:hypothetical protein
MPDLSVRKGCPGAAFFWLQALALVCLFTLSSAVMAQHNPALPDASLTPGAVDPSVTPHNLQSTVCVKGYTARVRPDKRVTNQLKREQMRQYRYADANPQHYEEDHLVPLNIGGSPTETFGRSRVRANGAQSRKMIWNSWSTKWFAKANCR